MSVVCTFRLKITVKMEFQCLIGDEFIDEHPLFAGNAVANKRDEVAVMNTANDFDLGLELSLALTTPGFEALDGNFSSVRQDPFVHVPEPTLAQQIRLRKSAGCSCKLLVRERALGPIAAHICRCRLHVRRRVLVGAEFAAGERS